MSEAAQILRDVQAAATAPAGQGISTFRLTIASPIGTAVDGRRALPGATAGEARSVIWKLGTLGRCASSPVGFPTALGQAPPVGDRMQGHRRVRIVGEPILGGLHHVYRWVA